MEFIEEQLESILSQTYPIYQLIISDDNSTDGTLEFAAAYVKEFAAKHKKLANLRFQTIENIPALGVTKNFEGAIQAATGELIALSDQDDIWIPSKLENLVKYFSADQSLLLMHSNALLVDANNQSLGFSLFKTLRASSSEIAHINAGNGFEVFLRRNLVTGATAIFRTNLRNIANPFPENMLHDEWLGLVASANGKIRVSEEQTIRYRQHGRNQVGATKLGVRHAIGRMIFPRTHRNQILLNRAHVIADRFSDQRLYSALVIEESKHKLIHEEQRSALPDRRIPRIIPIIKEIRTGRYKKYGLGFADWLRDFIQPV